MSAFVVNDDTITALLAGYNHHVFPSEKQDAANLTSMGRMLLMENCRSVNHHYPHHDPATDWDEYEFPEQYVNKAPITDPVVLIKLAECLEYQSCECDDYLSTKAFQLLHRMEGRFITKLKGWGEAPWGLDSITSYKPAQPPEPQPAPVRWANERPTTPDRGGMRLTPKDALCRQAWDIAWYGDLYPGGEEALREAVKARTNLVGLHRDQPYDITLINERIPRGGAIESMCGIDGGGN